VTAYLRNIWYLASWGEEVVTGRPLARTFLDEPVLLFRRQDGTAAAIADTCPHRFAPLSMGYQVGDSIRCAYHGLEFDGSGACLHNPHGRIPSAARVRAYPLQEAYGALWIWMGAPEKADCALLPDLSAELVDRDDIHVQHFYHHVGANYELLSDNILDLSHIEYLHPTTFGTPAVGSSTLEVRQDGDTVVSFRKISNDPLTPLLRSRFGEDDITFDRYLDVRWHAPATLTLNIHVAKAGEAKDEGFYAPGTHIFTPETATSSHYFMTGRGEPPDEAPSEAPASRDSIDPILDEDKPMLEAQQRRIGSRDFWDLKPVLLSVDAGGVLARRLLARRIKAEQEPAPAAGS
jgi:phenylpropionate dioxygenase-like ring-hydroxylating dioxygenase large terminal subunit